MTRISNKIAYAIKSPVIGTDYFPITNSVNSGVGMAVGATKSADFNGVRDFVIAGLNPEIGGTLKFTEIEYNGELTSPASVANALDPDYTVAQYEVLFFNINGDKYILKLQDVTIGDTSPNIADSDFIKILAFTQLGDGTPILKGYNVATGNHEFYAIKSTGLDISIVTGNVVIEKKAGSNLGNGIAVYKGLNDTTKIDEFYNLKSSTLNISKEIVDNAETGNVLIEVVEPVNNKSFYVDANSEADTEEGTLAKPYKTLKNAILAYKGTGTIYNPQYSGKGTIVLLSDVIIPATGDGSMTNFSINQLRINGNGYSIIYRGTEEYFISTAYLISQDPKTTSGKLDYPIWMYFEDVTISSESVHGIIYHLNYTSPSSSGSQNSSSISFKNCNIIDNAYLSEEDSYTPTSIPLFGTNIKVQNGSVLSKTKYTVKNEGVNWYGEGAFDMDSCRLQGSSSTIFYNFNSSVSWFNIRMDFNSYYANFGTLTSGVYSPISEVYFIYNYNDGTGTGTNGKRASNFLRIENFKEQSQEASSGGSIVGGADSFYKGNGFTYFEIKNGSFYGEQMNNLIQLNTFNSDVTLFNFDCTLLSIADNVFGALKYTGTTPSSRKFINTDQSIIPNVKYNASFDYILPLASSAVINGAQFTTLPSYADNTEALVDLIPNCIYYNTTTNIATRVV